MLKCFTANNEKPSLRLADKKAKEQRAEDNGKRVANAAAQNNKYYIEIYLEKTKTKTEKQRTKRAAEAKQICIFKAHAKRKKEKQKNQLA